MVAPYGTWSSPLSADLVARAGVRLTMPTLENGVARWLEGRADEGGRVVLVQTTPGGAPSDVTPADFNLRTMVHEYGGGAYCVHDDVVFCSRFDDQRLYRIDPGSQPVPITPDVEKRRQRYADGRVTPAGDVWIGVRERHAESGHPAEVVNELVALPTDGSAEPRVIAEGRDFYSSPRISPDGTRICFLAWDLPWMPWDGCELFVADLAADGSLGNVTLVAGRDGDESIWQPEWSPAGDLVFASDRSGWWNLERIRGDERTALHPAEAEFGYPAWVFGGGSYAFLEDGTIVCSYESDGRTWFAVLDPETGSLEPLDLPYDSWWGTPQLAAEGMTALFVAGSATTPNQVVALDVATRRTTVLRTSVDVPIDTAYFSVPRPIEFPTENGLTAHALFYPPVSPDHVGAGRRVPAADRHEPRRPDGCGDEDPRPPDAVLDDAWLRVRGRQLRRLHGLRARVSRAAERRVGGRRPRRLRQRGPLPGRARRGGSGQVPHPRRQRRRLHDDLCAHVHRRLRCGRVLLRHRRPGADARRAHAQVRAALRAHAPRPVSRSRGDLSRAEPDQLRRAAGDADARPPGDGRRDRPAGAGRAHRGRAARAWRPARLPPVRGRGPRLPQGREHRRLARGGAVLLRPGPRFRARRRRAHGSPSSTSEPRSAAALPRLSIRWP